MATVLQKLRDEGWFFSDEGLKKLNENGSIADIKELTKRALDHDLRELVTNGGLPNDFAKSSKIELPSSGIVLQVINVRNVSAPKVNQESKASPRLLQIDLTDGQTLCSGLDMEHLSSFNINVAPGTKVLLRNTVKVIQGFLSLTPQNICIMGGQVYALYEKWETNRTLAKYTGIGGLSLKKLNSDALKGSPPPWIPFGNKMKGTNSDDAMFSFKSFNATSKTKEVSKEESEFLSLRNNAIAEASTKGNVRKQFGGSNRQLMDHNVKKIMDKGFSEEQAKQALKGARNNLERAMNNLKKRNGNGETFDKRHKLFTETSAPSSRRGGKSDEPLAKPSGKVSLFDFLSDKIPDVEQPQKLSSHLPDYGTVNRASNSQRNQTKFENNVSSSFANRHKKDESQSRPPKWNDNNAPERSGKSFQQYQASQHQPPSYKSSLANNQAYQSSNQNYNQNNAKNVRYSAPANILPASDSLHQYSEKTNKRPTNDRKTLPNASKHDAPQNTKPKPNVRGLINETANLQISNDSKQQHKTNQSQVPPAQQQRNTNFEEMFPQANFSYNPYKIMGFQNKETNEFAMNVLKMGDQKVPNAGNNVYANNNLNNVAIPSSQSSLKHTAHMSTQQIPIVPAPKTNFISPIVPPYTLPEQFMWNFKVGDQCLAKYWEDEKYYNAEIQAVTDKTCVVHFPEYGNFEEVLHTDCLPITDANHQPINQSQPTFIGMQPIHPIAYNQLLPNKAHFHQAFHAQTGPQPSHHSSVLHPTIPVQPNQHQQPQRYRGNRQVYVPPAQRK